MAREIKPGIPYFSHDVYMTNDIKIKILIAKHGLIGYGFYNRLLEEIYQGNGYFLQITDDFNILFANDCNLSLDLYSEILDTCIEKCLFDKEKYHQYSILTSNRIQKNYIAGTKRRDSVEFIEEYLLEDPLKFYNTDKVDVNIISLNVCIEDENANIMLTKNDSTQHDVDIISKNADIGTQSKVKKSKVKKSNLSAFDNAENDEESYITKKGRVMRGKRLRAFDRFWECFDYKKGKADAADVWFDIKVLTDPIVDKICLAAEKEAGMRQQLIDQGRVPKMAQGWLSGRRWEDEECDLKNKTADFGANKALLAALETENKFNG